jgi:hypothetical protein
LDKACLKSGLLGDARMAPFGIDTADLHADGADRSSPRRAISRPSATEKPAASKTTLSSLVR